MIDMRATIIPKSDQINADDLIGGPRTITVSKVSLLAAADQPVAIHFEGDGGKPYKPCKSMRRVIVMTWGPDGAAYVGRSMTLYRDEGVAFGGQKVGGIRISHMTHITKPITMALTATRGRREGFTVQPLQIEQPRADDLMQRADAAAAAGTASYATFWSSLSKTDQKALLPGHDARKNAAKAADEAFDPDTGEVTDAQADTPAIDWAARLKALITAAQACPDTDALVALKTAHADTIKDMPDDVFADWSDAVDAIAANLKR